MRRVSTPFVSLVAAAFALLVTGCRERREPEPSTGLPTVTVRLQPVESKRRLATEEVVGTVRPKLSAVIAAKVSGTVEAMLVAPGQSVKAGESLARIDAREIKARLDQALAVRDQVAKDVERFTRLLADKAVTQQEFDSVQARQRVANAAVTEAETMLGYTQISAPFEGVITRKLADVGDLATPGKPLLEMENPAALRLEADVPEAVFGNLKLGEKLPVRVAAVAAPMEGIVSEISPAADPASRTFLVKLDLPTVAGLRSGQFGRVAIPISEVRALRVPAAAVVQRGQMELAFVVADGVAHLRLVKTGKRLGDEIEIVSGLEPGERVVVENPAALLDGQPVEVK
ncbi:MAG: efflux RND transporter periplasmic adaptor subunit [Verrucomicrobia bacterium]|nr:efflux RND transporter periplasmic adaptor subunit [Verrucomicrobiota bacterium]